MLKRYLYPTFLLLMTYQTSIAQQQIAIETKHNSLILSTDASNALISTYLGKRIANKEEYSIIPTLDKYTPGSDDLYNKREAYIASGSINLLEPALSVTHADGNKSTVLTFQRVKVTELDKNRKLTAVVLKDPKYNFEVTLNYLAYYEEDVIEQWSEIRHQEKAAVVLNKYASANLSLSGKKFYLKNQYSSAMREMRSEEQQLLHGLRTLDSKLGTRTNLLHSSSFMISIDGPSAEDTGNIIAGSLAWTGNFKLDFETFDDYYLRVTAGINNFSSDYTLKPGENFITPRFVYTYSSKGTGLASRNLQNWARKYQLREGQGERSTLLNNWETTYFDFNDEKLNNLVQDTKKLGVDVFLLDDGWFGNKYPRNGPAAGLGDWEFNKQKLKNGISAIGQEATANGVKFGIWLEPEMVNPKSELYEQHPDWIIRQPERKEYYMRNQLVLDLTNKKVQDFIFKVVDETFSQVPDLAFIKWDCNSLIYNANSPTLKNQDHFYIEYVRGLNSVLERIRKKYPKVPMMLCAGGGSRVDYAALQYFTEFWPSDNTNPFDRIFIQWEYSYYFPSIAVDNHVTDMGRQPIKFKTDVAMMGKLGYDVKVHELSEKDLAFTQNAIKTYNGFKDIVWHGQQYRLQDPYQNDVASISYVNEAKDQAVVFSYYMATRNATKQALPIALKGLDASKRYKIEEINLYPGSISPIDSAKVYSGDFLMNIGLNPEVSDRRTSVVLKITAV
ncbi:alpha-galactosidase [Pedobacter sp. PACM 27299]|uniref:alpha-galactosidase n=1 Tax=Pedobacter sp. PACM 27299 TaxID=1727164 RepID=UPI000706AB34|nr:alpha-galactosidase [Pedobacter sp. PACM 27299]ALL08829.1 alpha-galactosidase [Pedobacter sp. PACM 27299]